MNTSNDKAVISKAAKNEIALSFACAVVRPQIEAVVKESTTVLEAIIDDHISPVLARRLAVIPPEFLDSRCRQQQFSFSNFLYEGGAAIDKKVDIDDPLYRIYIPFNRAFIPVNLDTCFDRYDAEREHRKKDLHAPLIPQFLKFVGIIKKRNDIYNKTWRLVSSCRTYAALRKVWPEGAEFFEPHIPEPQQHSGAIMDTGLAAEIRKLAALLEKQKV